jgi:hypothetical protein
MSRQNIFLPGAALYLPHYHSLGGSTQKPAAISNPPQLGYYLQNNVLVYRKYIVG